MKYIDRYEEALMKFDNFKKGILDEIVSIFDKLYRKPLELGNMVFYVCCDERGEKTPAYKYNNTNELNHFQPIYDKNCSYDFGWADFTDVCAICDKIKEKIGKELGLDWQDEEWIY